MLVGLGTALHAAEAWLLPPLPVPGLKMGLANIVTLLAILWYGWGEALLVAAARVLVGSLVTGGLLSLGFWLSLSGALVSAVVMYAVWHLGRRWFSISGVSITGALAHNMAQLMVFSLVVEHGGVWFYAPYLAGFSVPAGIFVGLVSGFVASRFDMQDNRSI